MNKEYIVRLTDDERQHLFLLTQTGKTAAYKIKHAHIFLQVDANGSNWSDEHVAIAFRCHRTTVRQRPANVLLSEAWGLRWHAAPRGHRRASGSSMA